MWKILPSLGNGKEEFGDPNPGSPPRRPKIAYRIAKAFGKSKGARPACEQSGPLLSLPYELLEQILDKVRPSFVLGAFPKQPARLTRKMTFAAYEAHARNLTSTSNPAFGQTWSLTLRNGGPTGLAI